MYTVELIVFDDDGSTHSSVIQVRIEGQQVADTAPLASGHFVLVALALLGIMGALRFRKPPSADLPKWTGSGGCKTTGNQSFPPNRMQRLKKTKREGESCLPRRSPRLPPQPEPTSKVEFQAGKDRLTSQFRHDDVLILSSPPHAVHSNDVGIHTALQAT